MFLSILLNLLSEVSIIIYTPILSSILLISYYIHCTHIIQEPSILSFVFGKKLCDRIFGYKSLSHYRILKAFFKKNLIMALGD